MQLPILGFSQNRGHKKQVLSKNQKNNFESDACLITPAAVIPDPSEPLSTGLTFYRAWSRQF